MFAVIMHFKMLRIIRAHGKQFRFSDMPVFVHHCRNFSGHIPSTGERWYQCHV